jgi:predicted ATPase
MIETIRLRNYKGHTDTEIACDRLTVLVGENASGKTSVLQAVQWVSEGLHDTIPSRLLRRGAGELEIALISRTIAGETRISASYEIADGVQSDKLQWKEGDVRNEDGSIGWRPVATWLSLSPEDLAASSRPTSVRPDLSSSGRGLPSVLAYLKLAETDRFQHIVERLRGVVPIVRDIGFSRLEAKETIPRLLRVEDRVVEIPETVTSIQDALTFDFVDADRVPASLVSEGTLLALGLLTALEVLDRKARTERRNGVDVLVAPPEVVLIDDLDRALHPRAQRALVKTLREILAVTPDLQIIATSHSPYLVDELSPSEVVVLGRNAAGTVVAKRLADFPDERLRNMLYAGELWMSEGDGWVAR